MPGSAEQIDKISRKILNILQDQGRIANAELARLVGLAPSAVLERVRRLEERGVLRGYEARVSPRDLGLGLLAFISIRVESRGDTPRAARELAELRGVQEVHTIAGEDCLFVKVRVADTAALAELLQDQVGKVRGVAATRTTIVLHTYKETGRLPVAERARGE